MKGVNFMHYMTLNEYNKMCENAYHRRLDRDVIKEWNECMIRDYDIYEEYVMNDYKTHKKLREKYIRKSAE